MHKRIAVFLSLFLLGGCISTEKPDLKCWSDIALLESFKKGQRILILAPHPDDEAIACAGIIQQALKAGAKVRVVYLTNGDHNELAFIVYEKRITLRQGEFIHMGLLRRQESIQAMKFLGLSEDDLVFLGYPDYGTFEIFCKYWQTKKPFRDRMTRISQVPYQDNPSYGAPYCGGSIIRDLENQILDYKPDKIFVSHPADVNVDHKALYLFLQVAFSDLDELFSRPQVYPYLVHFVGWPKPRHYHPELELYPPEQFINAKISWRRLNLSFDELDKKYRSILFYKSQTQSSAFYLFSFARENELFGDYPILELTPQPTLKDKVISYFGAQKMFKETENSLGTNGIGSSDGKGSVSFAEQDSCFIVRVDKPKRLNNRFGVLLYIFGYKKQAAFAQMPKIRIITSANKCKVFNGKDKVVSHGVILDLGKNYLILKIPLELLGRPEYILTSLKAYNGYLPVDVVGFRKIRFK